MRKPAAAKGTSIKKVKKRNPWSDDESQSDSDMEDNEPIIPRETKSQRASGRTSAADWAGKFCFKRLCNIKECFYWGGKGLVGMTHCGSIVSERLVPRRWS